VVLENDVREDDAEHIINALRMVRGVISVSPNVGSYQDTVAQERAYWDWVNALHDFIDERRKNA